MSFFTGSASIDCIYLAFLQACHFISLLTCFFTCMLFYLHAFLALMLTYIPCVLSIIVLNILAFLHSLLAFIPCIDYVVLTYLLSCFLYQAYLHSLHLLLNLGTLYMPFMPAFYHNGTCMHAFLALLDWLPCLPCILAIIITTLACNPCIF